MEFKSQRVITTKALAEAYGTKEENIKTNFNRNLERFIKGKHYYQLIGDELQEFKRVVTDCNDPSIKFASVLNLWTERGAARHAKILQTDEAWEVYEQLEENYFNPREKKPSCIEDILITQLQEMKDIRLQIETVKKAGAEVKQEIQSMRDVYTLNPNSWRTDTTHLINAIAKVLGGFDHIKDVREETYKTLDERAGARLGIRLTNMKKNVLVETGSKCKSDKVSKLDVIAADKKLIEVYCLIVKEMAIKYKAA